ncbi:hypothetical protein D3C77_557800 [compost metagenome]
MNARQSLAALAVQNLAGEGEGRIGGDAAAQGLAGHALHHIGFAEAVLGPAVAHQPGHGHARLLGGLQQPGLDRQRQGGLEHLGLAAPAPTTQDQGARGSVALDVEGPGLKAGAAGQPAQAGRPPSPWGQARRQGVEARLDDVGRLGCGR